METFKQCKIIPGVYFRIILIAFFWGRDLNVLYFFVNWKKAVNERYANLSCQFCNYACVSVWLINDALFSLSPTFSSESCLVSDELLQYRHFVTKQLFDRDLTDEEEEDVLAQFAALDPEKKGQIEWSDFLYHETLSVLQKFRTQVKWDRDCFLNALTVVKIMQYFLIGFHKTC